MKKIFIIVFLISIVFQSCTMVELSFTSSWIDLEGVENVRQITVNNNPNVILRTGELLRLTDSDKKLLADEYQLTHIIDLRDEVEVGYYPDPIIDGVEYHHFNVWRREVRLRNIEESTIDGITDSNLFIEKYYTVFAFDPNAIEAYRNMFAVLLKIESGSVLIHCTHGKDRTGIAITLILYALGFDWGEIEREYLLSNAVYAGSVDIYWLRYYRDIITQKYGSMENYLEIEIGLDANNLRVLRKKYSSL